MNVVDYPISELLRLPITGLAMAGTTGFQSPADDYQESRIDIAKELVSTIASVFCMRAQGGSMIEAGIWDGDILVCDCAHQPKSGDIVIADHHDLRVVKRLRLRGNAAELLSEAKGHAAILVDPDQGVRIVAVVIHTVHTF